MLFRNVYIWSIPLDFVFRAFIEQILKSLGSRLDEVVKIRYSWRWAVQTVEQRITELKQITVISDKTTNVVYVG